MFVVLVKGLLEVPVLGQRRLGLERLDQLVPFCQIIALGTLSGDAWVFIPDDVWFGCRWLPVFMIRTGEYARGGAEILIFANNY